MLADAPNIQSLWGDLIVEELVRNSVNHFVVCPGSRSTPLIQAIARNADAEATIWLDERGGAFHALGRARAEGWPCAVVTTSGTAVANLLPAVVEASLDGVPMILLTADRPHELREVGANQSIKQTGIFADHVRWMFDLPAPDLQMPARAVLTTVDEGVHRARGAHPGPVQLNCPFREPLAPTPEAWDRAWLEPIQSWLDDDESLVAFASGEFEENLFVDGLLEQMRTAKRGVVVMGTLDRFDAIEAVSIAGRLGWPVWTDVRSGMRLGPRFPGQSVHLDRLLATGAVEAPDVVLQFGGRLTSKRMQTFLDAGHADTYILVDADPSRMDPGHQVTNRVHCAVHLFCETLEGLLESRPHEGHVLDVASADARVDAAVEAAVETETALTEPWVARWLTRRMDKDHALFIGNSMPIRDVQHYGATGGVELDVGTNRGASGIDGNVSTAAGFAQGSDTPATLLTGDLTLLHDVNALAMLPALEHPLTIVVVNNGGGGIFSFLPIAEHEDVLRPYVETPHDIHFEGICASFGLPYAHVDTRDGFETAYKAAIASGRSSVIEVASDIAANKAHHERIEAAIDAALRDA